MVVLELGVKNGNERELEGGWWVPWWWYAPAPFWTGAPRATRRPRPISLLEPGRAGKP